MNNSWWVKPDDLDPRQKSVIDLPLTESHLIVGPPGSGKTNLLLLRASQLVRSGKPNVLILVFTRTLREFVATGGIHYAFSVDKIQTLGGWAFRFLRDNGVTPAKDGNFEKQRRQLITQIQDVITRQKLSGVYDAIVLDESQDYLSEELDVFFHLGNVVFAAADLRQKIYVTDKACLELEARFRKHVYPLKHHYRNGHKICQVADALAKVWGGYPPLMPTSNYPEAKYPSKVEIFSCSNLKEQISKAADALALQLKAYPDEHLGVLCPTRAILKTIWPLVSGSPVGTSAVLQSAEDGYVEFEPNKPICVCTIHGAKGLEFRTVHIVDSENIKKSSLNRNIAYTAVTRAKTTLSIYHTGQLPAYLDSALNVVRPPVPKAKLEELFKTR